jgi:hypothetical protein
MHRRREHNIRTTTRLASQHAMKGLLFAALALALLCSVRADYDYRMSVTIPQTNISLASYAGVTTLTSAQLGNGNSTLLDLGSFSIPFYNETITTFRLNANGFVIFGPLYGDELPIPAPKSVCPFPIEPQRPGQENLPAFHKGFAFGWSDYDWTVSNTSTVHYLLFAAGSCPYTPKKDEACLAVQFIEPPYYLDPYHTEVTTLGNITAFIFESGDVFSQVVTSSSSAWGVQEFDSSLGVNFGISDLEMAEGVTFPGAQYCNITDTYGWTGLEDANLLHPGDSFRFYIAAPCGDNQSPRADGLGCSANPAAPLAAAWIEVLRALIDLF